MGLTPKMLLDFEASIFRVMEEQGIMQKELAKRLGMTLATVSKTLSETSDMTFKTAAKIAHAIGCIIDAPVIRAFDANEHGAALAVTRTAAEASTVAKKDDYTNASRSEKKEQWVSPFSCGLSDGIHT